MKTDNYYTKLQNDGYFENIDKRTKDYRDYKEWKSSKEFEKIKANVDFHNENSRVGLGDVVEKVTEATGIKKLVKAIVGDDCGCDERKEKFNKAKNWRAKRINCISEQDYKWTIDVSLKRKTKWKREDVVRLVSVYNNVFNTRIKPTSCSSCVRSYQSKLLQYLEIYNS
tara:strand:- start:495 stop:1001 length:507 start_codon:yes stop_codon:yes gene_type:complete